MGGIMYNIIWFATTLSLFYHLATGIDPAMPGDGA